MKLRLLLLSVLAMLGVGVVTASSASAAFTLKPEKCTEGKTSVCWDETSEGVNLRELSGEQEILFTLKPGTMSIYKEETKPSVELLCTEGVELGKESVILQAELLVKETTLDITSIIFKGCKADTPVNCTIPATLTTNPITGMAVNQAAALEGILFKPTAGENANFIEIKFIGEECLLKGVQAVKGSQIGLFPTDDVDLTTQELKTEASESKLFFGPEAAKATLELSLEVTLPGLGDPWDIVQS
jgi:hypothetical protein